MEYYSAIKKNKMPFAAIWMDLEIIRLSEVSLRERDKYLMTLLICGTFKKKITVQMNLFPKQKLSHRCRKQT